jgi:UDP:flavonoid glycosyltransferase YjiC (YdhE family)
VSRFLFVVPPFAGHINPTAGVAAELVCRGHQVAWAGASEVLESLVDGEVYDCAVGLPRSRPDDLRGFAALQYLWAQVLVPLADDMHSGVEAAVDQFCPDVVVVDQQAIAGALVANRRGLPWATSATTSAGLIDPLAGLPKVAQWLADLLTDLQKRHDDPTAGEDPRFSRELVLAFSTPELVGEELPNVQFVGPSTGSRQHAASFDWSLLDRDRALVLVTLGTLNADAGIRFLTESLAALQARTDRLQAVVVDPSGSLADQDSADVIVRRRVPQVPLLERANAVVCHAGHNTVCEALDQGVPLVVAPIRDDQPVVADQVVRAGAGVRLRFGKATAAHIGTAIDTVLDDPAYREKADIIRKSFRNAGGSAAAASHLESLIPRT